LLVLTKNNNLVYLRQAEEKSSYHVFKKISLSNIEGLSAEIHEHSTKSFASLGMSEKCLTTKTGKIFIIETGHSQPLSSKESGVGWSVSHLETNN